MASELSVELLQTFAVTLERLALIDDKPRSALLTLQFWPFHSCAFQ